MAGDHEHVDVEAAAPPGAPVAGGDGGTDAALDLGYTVTVDSFSGPLDLLLYLVRRTELDILEVPLALIVDQFIDTVRGWQNADLDVAGDFILMAATLLELKARTIAPPQEESAAGEQDEPAFDPRESLLRSLLAYRRFKEAAQGLDRIEDLRRPLLERQVRESIPEAPPEEGDFELGELDLNVLMTTCERLMARIGGMGPRTVMVDEMPLGTRIAAMLDELAKQERTTIRELLAGTTSRVLHITTVMATLELTRQRFVEVAQPEQFGDITLRLRSTEEREREPELPAEEPDGPRRRRRPPLVTFHAPAAPTVGGEEDPAEAAAPEEPVESDEVRFLRELEEATRVTAVLAITANVEASFTAHWYALHPELVPVPAPAPEPAAVAPPPAAPARSTSRRPPPPRPVPVPAGEATPAPAVEPGVVASSAGGIEPAVAVATTSETAAAGETIATVAVPTQEPSVEAALAEATPTAEAAPVVATVEAAAVEAPAVETTSAEAVASDEAKAMDAAGAPAVMVDEPTTAPADEAAPAASAPTRPADELPPAVAVEAAAPGRDAGQDAPTAPAESGNAASATTVADATPARDAGVKTDFSGLGKPQPAAAPRERIVPLDEWPVMHAMPLAEAEPHPLDDLASDDPAEVNARLHGQVRSHQDDEEEQKPAEDLDPDDLLGDDPALVNAALQADRVPPPAAWPRTPREVTIPAATGTTVWTAPVDLGQTAADPELCAEADPQPASPPETAAVAAATDVVADEVATSTAEVVADPPSDAGAQGAAAAVEPAPAPAPAPLVAEAPTASVIDLIAVVSRSTLSAEPTTAVEPVPTPTLVEEIPIASVIDLIAVASHSTLNAEPTAAAEPVPPLVQVPIASVIDLIAVASHSTLSAEPTAAATVAVEPAPASPAPLVEEVSSVPVIDQTAESPSATLSAEPTAAPAMPEPEVAATAHPEPLATPAMLPATTEAVTQDPVVEVAGGEPAAVPEQAAALAPGVPTAAVALPPPGPPPPDSPPPPDAPPPRPPSPASPNTSRPTTTKTATNPMSPPPRSRIRMLIALIALFNLGWAGWTWFAWVPTDVVEVVATPAADLGDDVSRTAGGGPTLAWRFNLDVVDDQGRELPPAVVPQITPPIAGRWHWQDRRTLVLEAAVALPLATTFSATLPSETFRTAAGFRLHATHRDSWSTAALTVTDAVVEAFDHAGTTIALTFNQPVDPLAIAQELSVALPPAEEQAAAPAPANAPAAVPTPASAVVTDAQPTTAVPAGPPAAATVTTPVADAPIAVTPTQPAASANDAAAVPTATATATAPDAAATKDVVGAPAATATAPDAATTKDVVGAPVSEAAAAPAIAATPGAAVPAAPTVAAPPATAPAPAAATPHAALVQALSSEPARTVRLVIAAPVRGLATLRLPAGTVGAAGPRGLAQAWEQPVALQQTLALTQAHAVVASHGDSRIEVAVSDPHAPRDLLAPALTVEPPLPVTISTSADGLVLVGAFAPGQTYRISAAATWPDEPGSSGHVLSAYSAASSVSVAIPPRPAGLWPLDPQPVDGHLRLAAGNVTVAVVTLLGGEDETLASSELAWTGEAGTPAVLPLDELTDTLPAARYRLRVAAPDGPVWEQPLVVEDVGVRPQALVAAVLNLGQALLAGHQPAEVPVRVVRLADAQSAGR